MSWIDVPQKWRDGDAVTDCPYVIWEELLTPEMLDDLIDYCDNLKLEQAGMFNKATGKDLLSVRNTKVGWIKRNELNDDMKAISNWIWSSITNSNFWNFDIRGFGEGWQYAEYGPGSKYDWHVDVGPNNNHRKLSLTIQLSDPKDYEGGVFHLEGQPPFGESKFMKKGATIMFPSHYRHKVMPVIKGMRKSLVIWVSGPRLK